MCTKQTDYQSTTGRTAMRMMTMIILTASVATADKRSSQTDEISLRSHRRHFFVVSLRNRHRNELLRVQTTLLMHSPVALHCSAAVLNFIFL